jgi:hypothetical protein
MKTNFLLVCTFISVFLGNTGSLFSQVEWYKKGQVYSYEVTTGFDIENYGIHTVTCLRDTIIENQTAKILQYKDKKGQVVEIFVQQQGEKLFHIGFTGEKELMFDFAWKAGDTTNYHGYVVESTDSVTLQQVVRKTQIWRKDSIRLLIIEGIGMVGDPLFSNPFLCSPPVLSYGCTGFVDGYDYYFRCFYDDGYVFDPYTLCMASLHSSKKADIRIWPKPATSHVIIRSPVVFDRLTIFDALGRCLYHQTFTPTFELEQADLPSMGTIWVQLWTGEKLLHSQQVILHNKP